MCKDNFPSIPTSHNYPNIRTLRCQVCRERDGKCNERFDTGHHAARVGKFFQPVRLVVHHGSHGHGRNSHANRIIGVGRT
jgi:hypothetical protein